MNSIQSYVIKFVIYLRQFGGISPDTPFFSTNKIDIIYRTEILLFKVVLNINNDNRTAVFFIVCKLLSNPIKNWLAWFRFMVLNATFIYFFRLYRGGQFYWRRKLEYPVKTTDLSQVYDKLYVLFQIP